MKKMLTLCKLKSCLLNKESMLTAFFVLFMIFCAQAQIVVKGKVKDKDDKPIPGASVKIKGTNKGAITDLDGNFKISVENPNQILVFSSTGNETKEVTVGAKTEINVNLKEAPEILEQMTVIGYGSMKQKDIQGAVGVAPVEEMQKQTSTTVSEALQGRIPGVMVKNTGEPGHDAFIVIRGISSIGSDIQPLMVIDGVPTRDSHDLNPEDIESVVVLKDASAAAIYGSRASNGVIVITTKKGVKGKSKINVSYKSGIQQITKKWDLMQTPEWLAMMRTKYQNAFGNLTSMPKIYDTTINEDWQKAITQQGVIKDINVSASGGSDNLTYMLSGGYFSNKGVYVGPGFDRYTARLNTTYQKGRLRVEENLALSRSFQTMNDLDLNSVIRMPPVIPVFDTVGNYTFGNYNTTGAADNLTNGTNPLAIVAKNHRTNTSYRALGNVTGEFTIFSWLKYKANAGIEYNPNEYRAETKQIKIATNDANPPGSLYIDKNYNMHKTLENWLTFDKKFNKHSISAMVGYTKELWDWESSTANVDTIKRDNSGNYYFNLSNGTHPAVGESSTAAALASTLGRVMYSYDDKYYFTGNIRRDGSSKFPATDRYGTFPSISGAWRLSNENFFKDVSIINKYINDFKIRASYGQLGNQAIGDYAYQQTLSSYQPYFFGGQKIYGQMPDQIINSQVKWETTVKTNIGFDMGLLKNKIQLGFDWYNNKSTHLLYPYEIQDNLGSSSTSVQSNLGSISNKGIEFTATYRKMEGDLKYSVTVNAGHRTNKVLALSNNNATILQSGTITQVGHEMARFYMIQYDGIYQNTHADSMAIKAIKPSSSYQPKIGSFKFIDANHDSVIDDNDRVDCGSPIPKIEYSINIYVEYKGFDLSIYFYGLQGRKVLNSSKYWLYNIGDGGNYKSGLLDESWTPANNSQTAQKAYYQGSMYAGGGTWQLEDGSFLRCKTLQIGYTIKPAWLKKAKIERARIYLSTDNLFTITKYKGLDPDFRNSDYFAPATDPNSYPNVRTLTCGLQFTF